LDPENKGPVLSDADKAHLAELVKELANKSVDPNDRPNLTPAESKDNSKLSKSQRKMLPRNVVDQPEADETFAKAFNVTKFPRDFEQGDFSVARWAYADARAKGADGYGAYKKHAPREAAYYEALSAVGTNNKALGEMVSGQDGGFLAPEIWANTFYDMLYSKQVLSTLPVTRMPMGGRVEYIPKLVSQVSVGYAAENAALTASQPQFAQLSFTARKQYAFVQIPNELLRDSAPAADQIIMDHATKRVALDRDIQALFGNGQGGAPSGLINATNVGSYTLAGDAGNGATPTYADFVAIVNQVRALNSSTNVPVGQADCTGVVGAVRVEQTVANLKDSQNRPLWAYGLNQIGRVPAPGFLGVPNWVLSNVVPTNVTKGSSNVTSYLIGGDWQYLIVMERQDVEFLSTNVGGTSFANDQTWIRLISRYDVGLIHPEAFTVANGVLA
jgi:HK97 family phage major capsid protein